MPYVEGFGTWPFGEEWLWEAIATSYLPLLDVLGPGAAVTLSLTPVLCDQLEPPGSMARCVRFLDEIRPESHRRDAVELRWPGRAEAGRRAGALGRRVRRRRPAAGEPDRPAGLLAALGRHASLDLVGDPRGAAAAGHRRRRPRCRLQTGIASHRRRFDGWQGGFWLPECAHARMA